MNPALWLVRSASTYPDHPALLCGTEIVADYREFGRRVSAMAGALRRDFRIKPDDRIAIFAKNSTGYLEALYAIWYVGAIAVPINAKLHPREVGWIVENSESCLLFTDQILSEHFAPHIPSCTTDVIELDGADYGKLCGAKELDQPVERGENDVSWLFYTSGTTGRPKGVMITNANIQAMVFSYFTDVDQVQNRDAAVYAAPISHGAGLYNFQHVIKAARHVVPNSAGFDPVEIFKLAEELENVHLFAAPTMVKRLTREAKSNGFGGEGIKTVVYGGGPMYLADIIEAVELMGDKFCQIYGQGESPMAITALPRHLVADRNHPRWRERLASAGTAQSCVEVRVADEDGAAVTAGITGEILVRGASVMKGYWRNQQASEKALRKGWLWTGDIGVFDEDGFLTLKDRTKDVIISGGSNIYPREVEEVLLMHPSVHEVSVVGRPSKDWGEEVVAFVVIHEDQEVSEIELDQHCLDHIARFKRPKEYLWLERLPKSNYGKVLKRELRKKFEHPGVAG